MCMTNEITKFASVHHAKYAWLGSEGTMDNEKIVTLMLITFGTFLHPSNFFLDLVLVDSYLYCMDLQNKIF